MVAISPKLVKSMELPLTEDWRDGRVPTIIGDAEVDDMRREKKKKVEADDKNIFDFKIPPHSFATLNYYPSYKLSLTIFIVRHINLIAPELCQKSATEKCYS